MGLEEEHKIEKEEYYNEIISEALNKMGILTENIVEKDEQRRKKQKKRHAIWNSSKKRRLH